MKMKQILFLSIATVLFICCKDSVKNISSEKPIILSEKNDTSKIYNSKKMNTYVAKDCGLTFDLFFVKFSNDSIFQKSRLKIPLDYSFYDNYQYEELTTEKIENPVDIKFIDFSDDENAINHEYDKFTVETVKTNERVIYKRVGYDTGLYITYIFDKIDDCWFLSTIIDEST